MSFIEKQFRTLYSKAWSPYLLIVIIACAVYLPFIGSVHLFDWDEINFAEASREMIATGDYFRVRIDYEPFWEKPPLFFWMQVLCMKAFGINEFSARLPNVVAGICTLCFLFFVGKKHYSQRFAEVWILLHGCSILPFFYFKSGIIDPWFNLFMFSGMYYLLLDILPLSHSTQTSVTPPSSSYRNSILAGIAIGLAILTKGPTGALLPGLAFILTLTITKSYATYQYRRIAIVALTAFLVCGVWFGVDVIQNGPWFLVQFFQYQIRLFSTGDAGHSQPLYYHFVVVFIGCFPASQFACDIHVIRSEEHPAKKVFDIGFFVLLCVVMTLFTIVQTKIVHYSSLAYFLVAYFGARALVRRLELHEQTNLSDAGQPSLMPRGIRLTVLLCGILWAMIFLGLCLIGINAQALIPMIRDEFVRGNLSMPVTWSYRSLIAGAGLFVSVIACWRALNNSITGAVRTIAWGVSLALLIFLRSAAPNIETYTQGAPIAFYQSLQGQDCYVLPLGYKSYAHLFYTRKEQRNSPIGVGIHRDHFEQWLIEGEIDKPAYFVCKSPSANDYRNNPQLEEIKTEGGFTFFRRKHILAKRHVADHITIVMP